MTSELLTLCKNIRNSLKKPIQTNLKHKTCPFPQLFLIKDLLAFSFHIGDMKHLTDF